jgi:hypothetical protein
LTNRLVLDSYEWSRYDYGTPIGFKLYQEDGITAYDATGEVGVVKVFKRHGDRAFFFRDVAKALTVIGQVAQIIPNIAIVWDTQASGIGHFTFTKSLRPSVPGYMWVEVEVSDNADPELRTSQLSSELLRVYVLPSEAF